MLYVILGLGVTGLSTAHYLHKKNLPFFVIDTRENPTNLPEFRTHFPKIEVLLGGLHLERLLSATHLILSPGLSPELPELLQARKQGIAILSDVELFAKEVSRPVIAITGSNAKGSVTTLVADMINASGKKALAGGNIGVGCLDLLKLPLPDVYVLELSSFQLETTYSLRAWAATILNISPDHLDRHGNMGNYIAAKQRIYQGAQNAIYNHDDQATVPLIKTPHTLSFGFEGDFHLLDENGKTFLAHHQKKIIATSELKIFGKHNHLNALAAMALASTLNLPTDAIISALQGFTGLRHRCQWIGEYQGATWFDDSKGTNVGATQAALEGLGSTLDGKIVLIAGGLGKGADFSVLRPQVTQFVKTIILFGQDAPLLEDALGDIVCCHRVNNLQEAVNLAPTLSQSNDAVLLSPACASLDMFKDYHDRGEQFITFFKELPST